MTGEKQTVTEIESAESFAEQFPDIHAEVFAAGKAEGVTEGQTTERALFAELKEACGDDHELLVQCYSDGKTAVEAMKLRADKLGKENTQLSEKVTELQKAKPAVEAARTEFSDTATPPGGEETGNANEEAWKAEFSASEDLKAEFGGDVEAYVAFKKADADGNVRIAHQS